MDALWAIAGAGALVLLAHYALAPRATDVPLQLVPGVVLSDAGFIFTVPQVVTS